MWINPSSVNCNYGRSEIQWWKEVDGYGLDDDWQEVMEMCSLEMASLKGSRLLLAQQHHNKSSTSGSKGSRLLLAQQHHNKSSTSGSKDNCLLLAQQHHNKIIHKGCEGLRLSPVQRRHNKLNSQLTPGFCLSHEPMYLRDYPKVTFLDGPLAHTHLHRDNCLPELHNGFCQSLA